MRLPEVEPLLQALPALDLRRYRHIAFHAPSVFPPEAEATLIAMLEEYVPASWPIVLHPDAVHDASLWRRLGSRVALENMDRRKSTGRTVEELRQNFAILPEARLCFDIGHARQCDTSMTAAYRILKEYSQRLVQLHVSEVNSASRHDSISYATKLGFQSVAHLIPAHVPLIIESRVTRAEISKEIAAVLESLPAVTEAVASLAY